MLFFLFFLDESKSTSVCGTSTSDLFAGSILREAGRRLPTPCLTRWNSLYDSFKVLSTLLHTKISQINSICASNNISTFTPVDKDIIKEFLLVMEPVTACLDKLQSEDDAYMGVLLPALYVLRYKKIVVVH